jgi:hypothetical protein
MANMVVSIPIAPPQRLYCTQTADRTQASDLVFCDAGQSSLPINVLFAHILEYT